MTKQLFDDFVGAPPPSTVDVPSIVAMERRRRGNRRIGLAAVAVAAVAVAYTAGVTLPHRAGRTTPRAASSPSASGAPLPGDASTFRLVADDQESAQATARRLTATLDDAVRRVAAGVRWLGGNLYGTPTADGPPPTMISGDGGQSGDQMFYGGSNLQVGARQGDLQLQVTDYRLLCSGAASANPKCGPTALAHAKQAQENGLTCRTLAGAEPGCVLRTGPHGERVAVRTSSVKPPKLGGPWSFVTYDVEFELPDGRVLDVRASNEVDGPESGGRPHQQGSPLSVDQVLAIATDIAGKIKP
jgi:hypothetical protein